MSMFKRLLPIGSAGRKNAFDLRSAWHWSVLAASPAEGDKDESEPGDGDDGDSDESGSGASGTDASGQEGSAGTDDKTDPEKKRLADEAAQRRIQFKAEKERADKAEAKLREFTDKDKSELEKAQRDAGEHKARADKFETLCKTQAVRLAFFESGAHALFRKSETAMKLLDMSGIEPDEDGNVDSAEIMKRSQALLKTDSYLAADGSSSDEDDGDRKASGQPNNGSKKSNKEADREALMKKFPALRR
jgi:hypothetical protein